MRGVTSVCEAIFEAVENRKCTSEDTLKACGKAGIVFRFLFIEVSGGRWSAFLWSLVSWLAKETRYTPSSELSCPCTKIPSACPLPFGGKTRGLFSSGRQKSVTVRRSGSRCSPMSELLCLLVFVSVGHFPCLWVRLPSLATLFSQDVPGLMGTVKLLVSCFFF